MSELVSRFETDNEDVHSVFHAIANEFFRADYLPGNGEKIEAGFGVFLCLSGEGVLAAENYEPLTVSVLDLL